VIGKNGAKISLAALNMHGPIFERVLRYQYYQDKPGVCILKVMGAPGFSDLDRIALHDAYHAKVGDEIEFVVQPVQDIPLTTRGKLKMLDSKLPYNLKG